MMQEIELAQLCKLVIEIVRPVGNYIREARKNFAEITIEKKGVRESMPDLAVVHNALNSYERNLTQYFDE